MSKYQASPGDCEKSFTNAILAAAPLLISGRLTFASANVSPREPINGLSDTPSRNGTRRNHRLGRHASCLTIRLAARHLKEKQMKLDTSINPRRTVDLLNQLSCLSFLSVRALRGLASGLHSVDFKRGEIILAEKDLSTRVHILLDGYPPTKQSTLSLISPAQPHLHIIKKTLSIRLRQASLALYTCWSLQKNMALALCKHQQVKSTETR